MTPNSNGYLHPRNSGRREKKFIKAQFVLKDVLVYRRRRHHSLGLKAILLEQGLYNHKLIIMAMQLFLFSKISFSVTAAQGVWLGKEY